MPVIQWLCGGGVNSIRGKWVMGSDMNFVIINDQNVIFDFDMFNPDFCTHQTATQDKHVVHTDGGFWSDTGSKHTQAVLAESINKDVVWGIQHNVSLSLGELGVQKATFKSEHGGFNDAKDMISVIKQYGIDNSCHFYHEDAFGLC